MTETIVRSAKRSITAMVLGFFAWGFVFLCRTCLQYLRPDLLPSELGTANLVLVVCVFFSAIIFTRLADKTNKHTSIIFFSLLICTVGQMLIYVSNNFGLLLFTRALVGIGAGPIFALACAVCAKNVTPRQFALACGIVCSGEGVISSFIGPSLMIAMLGVMSWQLAGWILGIPVIIVGVLYLILFRNKANTISVPETEIEPKTETVIGDAPPKTGFSLVFSNRNALLCLFLGIISMIGLWSVLLYAPDYWMSVVGLSDVRMGFLMSGMGIAYVVWNIVLSLISDVIGRRLTCGIFAIITTISLLAMFVIPMSSVNQVLFVLFSGLPSSLSMFFFTTIPMESVGEQDAATAGGIINGASDLIGAAIIPFVLGLVADNLGLSTVYLIAAICMVVAVILSFSLKETAPRVLEKKAKQGIAV